MIILNEDATAKFDINVLGETTKQTYLGTFEVNCILSPLEEIEADKTYRSLLGDTAMLMADQRVKEITFALSQLKVRLISFPPFWENHIIGGGHIKDYNVIFQVLDLAIKATNMYKEKLQKEAEVIKETLTKAIKTKKIKKEVKEEIEEKEEIGDEGDL
jgi:hypothetical protein